MWRRYWEQNKSPKALLFPVKVPQVTRDKTRPTFPLFFKLVNRTPLLHQYSNMTRGFHDKRLYLEVLGLLALPQVSLKIEGQNKLTKFATSEPGKSIDITNVVYCAKTLLRTYLGVIFK